MTGTPVQRGNAGVGLPYASVATPPITCQQTIYCRKIQDRVQQPWAKDWIFFFSLIPARDKTFWLLLDTALVIHQTLAEVLDQEEKFLNLFLPRTVSATRNFEAGAAEPRHFSHPVFQLNAQVQGLIEELEK